VTVRTFRWLPADGARHAIPRGLFAPGEEVLTLADETVRMPQRRPGELEWLWPTCLACWAVAKERVQREDS